MGLLNSVGSAGINYGPIALMTLTNAAGASKLASDQYNDTKDQQTLENKQKQQALDDQKTYQQGTLADATAQRAQQQALAVIQGLKAQKDALPQIDPNNPNVNPLLLAAHQHLDSQIAAAWQQLMPGAPSSAGAAAPSPISDPGAAANGGMSSASPSLSGMTLQQAASGATAPPGQSPQSLTLTQAAAGGSVTPSPGPAAPGMVANPYYTAPGPFILTPEQRLAALKLTDSEIGPSSFDTFRQAGASLYNPDAPQHSAANEAQAQAFWNKEHGTNFPVAGSVAQANGQAPLPSNIAGPQELITQPAYQPGPMDMAALKKATLTNIGLANTNAKTIQDISNLKVTGQGDALKNKTILSESKSKIALQAAQAAADTNNADAATTNAKAAMMRAGADVATEQWTTKGMTKVQQQYISSQTKDLDSTNKTLDDLMAQKAKATGQLNAIGTGKTPLTDPTVYPSTFDATFRLNGKPDLNGPLSKARRAAQATVDSVNQQIAELAAHRDGLTADLKDKFKSWNPGVLPPLAPADPTSGNLSIVRGAPVPLGNAGTLPANGQPTLQDLLAEKARRARLGQ